MLVILSINSLNVPSSSFFLLLVAECADPLQSLLFETISFNQYIIFSFHYFQSLQLKDSSGRWAERAYRSYTISFHSIRDCHVVAQHSLLWFRSVQIRTFSSLLRCPQRLATFFTMVQISLDQFSVTRWPSRNLPFKQSVRDTRWQPPHMQNFQSLYDKLQYMVEFRETQLE